MLDLWIEDLRRDLQDVEFAKLYGAEQSKDDIAITLAKARTEQGLTQKDMARKIGKSQPYIAKLERGDANPTIGVVGSMFALLGLRLVTDTAPLLPQVIRPEMSLESSRTVANESYYIKRTPFNSAEDNVICIANAENCLAGRTTIEANRTTCFAT